MFKFETRELANKFLNDIKEEGEVFGKVTLGQAKEFMGFEATWMEYSVGWNNEQIQEAIVMQILGEYHVSIDDPQVI